jgi:hypothetical protein
MYARLANVAPSERCRQQLDDALAGVDQEQDPAETIGRPSVATPPAALKDEVTEFLGRARCERAAETVSHRDGYEPRNVRTTSGTVGLELRA